MQNVTDSNRQRDSMPSALARRQWPYVLGFASLSVLVSALAWMLFRKALGLDLVQIRSAPVWSTILGAALAFFALFSLIVSLSLLVPQRWTCRGLLALLVLPYLAIFGAQPLMLGAALVLLLGVWLYDSRMKAEQHDRRRFSVAKIAASGLPFFLTLLIVVLTVTFYVRAAAQARTAPPLERITDRAANTVNAVLRQQVPGYDPAEPFDLFFLRVAAASAEQSQRAEQQEVGDVGSFLGQLGTVDPNVVLGLLPSELRTRVEDDPAQLPQLLQEQTDVLLGQEFIAARTQFLEDLGVQAEGTTPVGEVVRSIVHKNIQQWLGPYENLLPTFFSVTFYFTLQVFAFVYVPAILLLTSLLFWMYQRTHLVERRSAATAVEYVVLRGGDA